MATIVIRDRDQGGHTYQVRWRVNGKQKSVSGVGKTDRQREANANKILKVVQQTGDWNPDLAKPGVPTVRQLAAKYLQRGTRGNDDTREDYRRILEAHVYPVLGDLAVTGLTVDMLTDWAHSLVRHDKGHEGERLSDKSRSNVTGLLSSVLEYGVPEYLPANPFRRVVVKQTDPPKAQHFLRAADFALILDEIPEHFRALVTTLAATGMRWGEASALTVGDLDLSSGLPVFSVHKAVKHRAKQTDKPGRPKTKRSVRVIHGPVEMVGVYQALAARPPEAPMFPAARGGRLRNSTFHTLVWQPALTRAEAKGLRFRPRIHDLRAAAVSWLIEMGLRPDEVQRIMGHEKLDTTMGIYLRANPEAGVRASAAMSGVLGAVLRPELEP